MASVRTWTRRRSSLPGELASYLVPTGNVAGWTAPGFNDAGWSTGETGLGFPNLVPGFAVSNYRANVSVGNLDIALQVINDPSKQISVHTETVPLIDFWNSDGQGRYYHDPVDAPNFPGFSVNPLDGSRTNEDNFVIEATATITIPSAGLWTFGVNSDDGFQLTIPGVNTTSVTNSSTPAGSDTFSFYNGRGAADSFGVYNLAQAGTYSCVWWSSKTAAARPPSFLPPRDRDYPSTPQPSTGWATRPTAGWRWSANRWATVPAWSA